MRVRVAWLSVLCLIAVSLTACGGSSPQPAGQSAAPASTTATSKGTGQKVDPATAATVTGKAMVNGAVPANATIKMNADPVCLRETGGAPQTMESFVLGPDGKSLANVFVYVKDGLGNYTFDPPTATAQIDQKDCRYHPHVFGVRVGQPIEIVNSDPTLHNIHAIAKNNREFNNGQPIQGMKTPHTFTAPEVMVPFKCDVHGWMNAYVGVVDHPFFAVTDESGSFSLKGLPPGTYTIEAWHEKLGTTTQTVTLAEKDSKDITFTFTAPAAATN